MYAIYFRDKKKIENQILEQSPETYETVPTMVHLSICSFSPLNSLDTDKLTVG